MSKTVQLQSVINGDGAPLVIVHGLFGQAKNWNALAKRFGENFTVHALDLRNHGNSPHLSGMTYAEMADDVAHYLAVHDLNQAAMIGHSMGGKVAMYLALTAPATLSRIIVADIAPVSYDHDFTTHLTAMADIDLASLKSRGEADKILASHIGDSGIRAFLASNLNRSSSDGWTWQVNRHAIADSMTAITGWPEMAGHQFNGPALFLAGSHSDYATPDMMPSIRQSFPAAEYDVIAEAGHWLHAEQPDRFFDRCQKFLAD
jgi:esterase